MGLYSRDSPLDMPLLLLLLLLTTATPALANVEKIIFTGPAPANIPLAKPTLYDLDLHVLTPESPSVRTNLSRVLPADGDGTRPAWLLLNNLAESQRYELRVCWAATEPTRFALHVYELDTVWQTPHLVQSLAEYATSRQTDGASEEQARKSTMNDLRQRKASALLLHVGVAADYFTDNPELMRNPPPVLVDLILDPYMYNLLPRSLAPTAGYLALISVFTWILARWIVSGLQSVAGSAGTLAKKQN